MDRDGQTKTLHGLLYASAARRPDRLCLRYADHDGYSYKQVADAVDRCAAYVAALDSDVVAVVAHRSYGLMLSLLSILRAGKAYCPIEPDFPQARTDIILETAGIKHVLVPSGQGKNAHALVSSKVQVEVLYIHDDGLVTLKDSRGEPAPADPAGVPAQVSDDALAYVIFTSGSTGKPKGCMVPHRGSCLYAEAVVKSCNLNEDMTFILKTPYVFDVHVQDIFSALCAGGLLEIAQPNAHLDAAEISDVISRRRVNCACFVPTLLVEFTNYLSQHKAKARGVAKHLSRVLTIGEALMSDTCKQLFDMIPDLQIHNLYGPTEASVGVSHHMSTRDNVTDAAVVPIGKPFDYAAFKVFDTKKYEGVDQIEASHLREVGVGEVGELFVGGDCLACGYVKAPKKTSKCFFHFPEILPRPPMAASPFSLYKTGDLVKRGADGVFVYLGRNDFQVKINGVRIECEEVSSILKTHPAVKDALVTAFDGPFGKALAAYVLLSDMNDCFSIYDSISGDTQEESVSKWGEVYDEMYKAVKAVSSDDPTLNWSGYTNTYSKMPHAEPVIKEWVEWSCEQVSRHQDLIKRNKDNKIRSMVTEIGVGNGMLLFRLAPLLGGRSQGRYIGTDISTTALDYILSVAERPEFKQLGIEMAKIAAHEVLDICDKESNDIVLCNGVTMYFPSANYLLECMQHAVSATKNGGFVIFGDIQSQRHIMALRCNVEVYKALKDKKSDANALSVLRSARKAAMSEELSYFSDELFHRLDGSGRHLFDGRIRRLEMRLKRGWWHSEFNSFRYDIEIEVCEQHDDDPRELKVEHISYKQVQEQLSAEVPKGKLINPKLVGLLPDWLNRRLQDTPNDVDALVVVLPNARTLAPTRLVQWLEANAAKRTPLADLPQMLHPKDSSRGTCEDENGIEPEFIYTMSFSGWNQRIIWDKDPAMMRVVFLRESVSHLPWLNAACSEPNVPLPDDFEVFRNNVNFDGFDSLEQRRMANKAFKKWITTTSLLPAVCPAIYIPLESFPLNQAGKVDRNALPDPVVALKEVSGANMIETEAPKTEEEHVMCKIWESVLRTPVGVTTPFVAYGGHSLTSLELCNKIFDTYQKRPDLLFLSSEECTVRTLISKLNGNSQNQESCVTRLSPAERKGELLLVFGGAGTSSATYRKVAKEMNRMQVYFVELPGHGKRVNEPLISNFYDLFDDLTPDVHAWAKKKGRFFVWGDSLGAVLSYAFVCEWQTMPEVDVLGFFVSGNAGPTDASIERGFGNAAAKNLGLTCPSCADLSEKDWKRFLVASAGGSVKQAIMESILDSEGGDLIISQTRADCLAYETYDAQTHPKLKMTITTMRGQNDLITATIDVRSWEKVAGEKCFHKEFDGAGHMLASECPETVGKFIMTTVFDS